MKKNSFAITALISIGCLLFSSCSSDRSSKGNNDNENKVTSKVVAEETVIEQVPEPEVRAYGCSHDGCTNIHKSPSAESEIIGTLRNGNDHVVVVGKTLEWVEVKFRDQTGYIHENLLRETPSKPVTVDVDAQWLEGVWSDSGMQYVLLFADGKLCIEHKYSTLNYGKWHLEGDEILLTMLADEDTGLDLSYPVGTVLRYNIYKEDETLGNGSGYEMVKWELTDVLDEEEGGLTTSEFLDLRKKTDKHVK